VTGLEDTERDQLVGDALAELAGGFEPPPNWEARVWARALRQQTAQPRRRPFWLRQLVPVVALAALVAVSAALGAALWRARGEIGGMKTAIERQQAQVEELRRDLIEARLTARSMRVENHQLEELATMAASCPGVDKRDRRAETLAAKRREIEKTRREYKERDRRARAKLKVACDQSDPLCGL